MSKIDDDYETESESDIEEIEDISHPKKNKKNNNEEEESDDEMDINENEEEDDLEEDDDIDDIENDEDVLNEIDDGSRNKPAFIGLDNFSDDEDEDEVDDPNYLQKFDQSIHRNIITEFHPELQIHNYEEIENLCRVVRDENGDIIDPLHKTLPFLSRYEKARILGERAKQIDNGAKPFVEVDETVIDGYLIATKEFEAKKVPFIIKRPLPNGAVEYWRLEDLVILE
jgi:DNA-directed RNA polymerase I, II, and III subunit RPABC2